MTYTQRLRHLLAAIAIVAMAATSLVANTGAAEAASGPTIRVFIGARHHISMTHHMRPGVHKFVVRSARHASFQLVRVHGDYSLSTLVQDANQGIGGGDVARLKRFERHVTLLGGVSSRPGKRGVMWARLARGTYWAVDTDATPLTRSLLFKIRVAGRRVHGGLRGTATIRAIHETDWAKRPARIASHGVLRFRNRAEDNHFVDIAKLKRGKTVADFRRWINLVKQGQDAGPPPINDGVGLTTGVVSPGKAMSLRYSLPSGRYVLVCWWPDADMGGLPHAFMGMYRGLRVR